MNEQEFLDFWKIIEWPEIKPIYYRLYYDDSGQPLFYSHEDQPGKYIDVTPEQFALRDLQVRVVDGVLKPRARPLPPKLVPGVTGNPCHTNDVSIIVAESSSCTKWSKRIDSD
jgi:hypothetical protein